MWQKRHVNMTKTSANDRCVRSLSQKELYEESTSCKLPVSRKITISMLLSLIYLIHYVRSSVLQLSCCGALYGKNAVVGNPAVDGGWYAVTGWGGAGDKLSGDHSVWQGRAGGPVHPKPVFKKSSFKAFHFSFRFSRDPTGHKGVFRLLRDLLHFLRNINDIIEVKAFETNFVFKISCYFIFKRH